MAPFLCYAASTVRGTFEAHGRRCNKQPTNQPKKKKKNQTKLYFFQLCRIHITTASQCNHRLFLFSFSFSSTTPFSPSHPFTQTQAQNVWIRNSRSARWCPHDKTTGAVIPAISLSTTFAQSAAAKPVGEYEYSRSANPNRDGFEQAIAALEKGKYGLAFSSGSAATATILQSLAQGSHVVSIGDVYGGTHRYFSKVANAHGVETTFSNAVEDELASLIRPETRLVWIESPSNPTLTVTDIAKVAGIVKQANEGRSADEQVFLVVDNTFMSPYVQNP